MRHNVMLFQYITIYIDTTYLSDMETMSSKRLNLKVFLTSVLLQLQNLTLFQYHNLDFSPLYILTLNKRKKDLGIGLC